MEWKICKRLWDLHFRVVSSLRKEGREWVKEGYTSTL